MADDLPTIAERRRLGVYVPDIENQMAERFGEEAARRLLAAFNGVAVQLPKDPHAGHVMAQAVGLPLLVWLCDTYGRRRRLWIPGGPFARGTQNRVRVRRLIMAMPGRTCADIARPLGFPARTTSCRLRGRIGPPAAPLLDQGVRPRGPTNGAAHDGARGRGGMTGQTITGHHSAQADNGATATVSVVNHHYHSTQARVVDAATIKAAMDHLATLPEDSVPEPADLPACNAGLPFRNRLFVGREARFKALAHALKHGGTAAIGQTPVISGWGGVGKSQLAVEFAWRYGRFFQGGVFWLNFAEAATVPTEIAACVAGLGLPRDAVGERLDDRVAMVGAHWRDGLPRLLIFDNCEDEDLFRDWCPRTGQCRVLLTTRRERWSPHCGVTVERLDTLPRAESIALLCRHRTDLDPDDPNLDAICAELGDLPLAVHVAGRYLHRYRHDAFGQPAAYLNDLKAQGALDHPSLAGDGKTPTAHDEHVAGTFDLSHTRLDPADPVDALARRALAHAARLAPGEPIPRDLLARCLNSDAADPAAARGLSDALHRLSDLGLIETRADRDGALVLHRLIAAFARDRDPDGPATADRVWRAVGQAAFDENETGLPQRLQAWHAHLRHAATDAEAAGTEAAGGLWNNLGSHLSMVGAYDGARAAYERALRIDENALGPDHPKVAIRVNNLGRVLRAQGDLDAAREASERALRIDQATFGPDHPNVARDVNNLGSVLSDQGDRDGARAAYERALRIFEATLGPDHPHTQGVRRNLSSLS